MIQSMFSGASGLRAHQTQMDVIGNNIANINTVGYKSSRAEFKTALSRTLRGAGAPTGTGAGGTDPVQVGLGVTVGAIGTIQTQGSLQYTGKPLDVAIEGTGYLVVNDGARQLYTRDGSLTVDSSGTLVTSSGIGYKVMGWNANPATGLIDATGQLSEIHLPLGQWALARQTSEVTYAGNLNADTPADSAHSVAVTQEVFDSLGGSHNLKISFTRVAQANPSDPVQWTWTAESFDPKTGLADGAFTTNGSGTLTFDSNGKVSTGGSSISTLHLTDPNGANQDINITLDLNSLTSLAAGDAASTATATSQNGLPLGTLNSYTIDSTGVITGTFSNGMTQAIAQIALADFTNANGLSQVGGNIYCQSANSGLPQIGAPASGGRGKVTSNYLEMSNVDLSVEFTNMIVAQRGYQANSRVITTSDELLQDLISLKR